MKHLPGFAPLAAAYEGFVLDLWGVVHDGVRLYPGAADCLTRLRDGLRAMGIADHLYDGVVTSGEVTRTMLRDRPDPWWRALGGRLYHIGPDRDRPVYADLGLDRAERPEDASFVLNTGPDDEANPTDPTSYDPVLRACRGASLPMICANPDLEVIRGGVRVVCAGALALRYEAMGGDVRFLGKPDPAVYGPVLDLLAVPRERVLAVGDALRTDIAGAAAASIASAWVLGGIHEEHLGEDRAQVEIEARASGLSPVATLPRFVW